MIIPTGVFQDVGLMYEDLFLDWADLEWCWRVNFKGYKIIGNADMIITHRIGDIVKKIWKKILYYSFSHPSLLHGKKWCIFMPKKSISQFFNASTFII